MSVNTFLTNKMKYSYRCVVPIKDAHVDDWLQPGQLSRDALFAILDDRQRPYYEHQLAA